MAKILQAQDALNFAIDANAGLEALTELMRSAKEGDCPSLSSISDLVWSVQKDISAHLDDIKRCLKD